MPHSAKRQSMYSGQKVFHQYNGSTTKRNSSSLESLDDTKWPPVDHIGYWPKRMTVGDTNGDVKLYLPSIDVKEKTDGDSDDGHRSIHDGDADQTQWGSKTEFVLSCVGYSVGLGNLWRFPYLCMKHGGGAFLIPYLILLFTCGMPLFFLELIVGQSTGLGVVRVFKLIPCFHGLGWCMVAVSAILCMYYNVIIAWVLYYIGMSFQWIVPWSHCNNTWNTPNCFTHEAIVDQAVSTLAPMPNSTRISATEEFWQRNVLEMSDSIVHINGVNWKLLVALIGSWVLTFLCMCKGIRSSGKIVYVTATAPYIFLLVILIRGVTLPGAWEGIKIYIVPDWERLTHISVWSEAAAQIFYSLGPAWGCLITFASFNKYNHKIMRDAMIIPTVCGLTSIFGGFAIFSVVGHLMYLTGNNDTSQFISQGPGLAFVTYPQALAKLPGAAIWSVLFFLMILTLGIDTQFAILETVITSLCDRFPRTAGGHRILTTAVICVIEFLLGIIFVTRAGIYYFELIDDMASAFSVVVIGFLESFAFAYLYGPSRLLKDVEDMSGRIPKFLRHWWFIAWLVIVPAFTFAVIIGTFVNYGQNNDLYLKKYPLWALIVGWILASLSFIEFPIFAVIEFVRHRANWRKVFRFSKHWQYAIEDRKKLFNGEFSVTTL